MEIGIDLITDLATRFWQFTVLGILIIIGFVINLSDNGGGCVCVLSRH